MHEWNARKVRTRKCRRCSGAAGLPYRGSGSLPPLTHACGVRHPGGRLFLLGAPIRGVLSTVCVCGTGRRALCGSMCTDCNAFRIHVVADATLPLVRRVRPPLILVLDRNVDPLIRIRRVAHLSRMRATGRPHPLTELVRRAHEHREDVSKGPLGEIRQRGLLGPTNLNPKP